jgi:DNA replication and repair protein RecF
MLRDLQLRNFRCFEAIAVEFSTGFNFIVGANGQGKTTLLEAACVLLRLQSQRTATLSSAIRAGERSFSVGGHVEEHLLQFYYSVLRRRVLFDSSEQRDLADYLRLMRVVSFANHDLDLIRGGAEMRRRYLDFIGSQIDPRYRPTLRTYERALRARNALLKTSPARPRELAAYAEPLVRAGRSLGEMRAALVRRIAPAAAASHREISGEREIFKLSYAPGSEEDFAAHLARVAAADTRLRVTTVGPHRDDLQIEIAEMPAAQFASEGQQRTAALALKLAQARIFAEEGESPPLLLIDDIFGELDGTRRNALLQSLPNESQKFVTATNLDWRADGSVGPVLELSHGKIRIASQR